MGSKRKTPKKKDPNGIRAIGKPGEDAATGIARTAIRPTVQAAATLREYGKSFGDLDLDGLLTALSAQTQATTEGDLARGESMLTAQAHVLDAVFNNLVRRAINSDYMNQLEPYLKLALRAQSQCRATWEAVATIKNPPMVGYVRQANIAAGHQQVNNGPGAPAVGARAEKNPNSENKLLEATDGERLDPGTAGTAGGADPALARAGASDA